jgi:hypothetical protein
MDIILKKDETFRTSVYVYGGFFGVHMQTEVNKGGYKQETTVPAGILNDPTKKGQLGVVMDSKYCDFSQEAIDVLKAAKREVGSFASVVCDSKAFGWCGGTRFICEVSDLTIGRDCDPSHYLPADIEAPQDFKDFIDNMLK